MKDASKTIGQVIHGLAGSNVLENPGPWDSMRICENLIRGIRESENNFLLWSIVDLILLFRCVPMVPLDCDVDSIKWGIKLGKLFGVFIPMAPANSSSICWRRTIENLGLKCVRRWRTFAVRGCLLYGQWTFAFAVDLFSMRYFCLSISSWVNSSIFDFLFAEGTSAVCSGDVTQRRQRVQLCAFCVVSRQVNKHKHFCVFSPQNNLKRMQCIVMEVKHCYTFPDQVSPNSSTPPSFFFVSPWQPSII